MTFALPTYGMPCCGHRVVEHGSERKATSASRDCRCCRSAERLADALLTMADPPTEPVHRWCDSCGHAEVHHDWTGRRRCSRCNCLGWSP